MINLYTKQYLFLWRKDAMSGVSKKIILLLSLIFVSVNAQDIEPNEYGLRVVKALKTYNAIVEKDSNKLLVDIKKIIPDIVLDIRYATSNNFIGEPVYNIACAYARLPVVEALKNIQAELKKENLGLKIFDAYRPYSVTVRFYEKVQDSNYAASPRNGSRHNRGCAVNLTIIDLKNGKEIVMPTGYDDFTEKAWHNFNDLPEDVIENREKLKRIMIENGFSILPSEWWHYDFNGWQNYELMDLSFEELFSIEKKTELEN